MMHTRGTRRMFLKMEPHRSLGKLGLMPVQRNCCNCCLRGWWIHPMRCALYCLWTICPFKAWMDYLRRGTGSSELTQPPPSSPNRRSSSSTSGILLHLFDPTLVLEECFWGGYFIMSDSIGLLWWPIVFVTTRDTKSARSLEIFNLCLPLCFILSSNHGLFVIGG